MEQVECTIKQQAEEMLMQRWIVNYEKEMSFDEFKSKLGIKSTTTEQKDIESILEDAESIINLFI